MNHMGDTSVTSVLDGLSPSIMLCDGQFNITYLNHSAQNLFASLEERFRARFPRFRADALVGQNMDIFHVRPEHQRRLLADPARLPYSTHIRFEGLVIGLVVTAATNAAGTSDGFILEWTDHTARSEYEGEVRRLATAASEGDLSFRGDISRMQGPYAEILDLVNSVFDGMGRVVNSAGQALERAAEGDLGTPIVEAFVGDHGALKTDYNRMIRSLSNTLGQVRLASEQMSAGSGQVAATAQSLAHGATTQAEAIVQISTTVKEIAHEAETTAAAARESDRMAEQATESAEQGEARMQSMLEAMDQVEEASREISRIIKVIDEIAFQTNLLALNAAVEAARAGVHGRGFAVVAEEVRNLAARSAKAAKETTSMIENTLERVQVGSKAARDTASALTDIVGAIGESRATIRRIAEGADKQAAGISEVHAGLQQIDRVTQQNTAAAEEAAAAAEELSSHADMLEEMLGGFQLSAMPPTIAPSFELPVHEGRMGVSPELFAALQSFLQSRAAAHAR